MINNSKTLVQLFIIKYTTFYDITNNEDLFY